MHRAIVQLLGFIHFKQGMKPLSKVSKLDKLCTLYLDWGVYIKTDQIWHISAKIFINKSNIKHYMTYQNSIKTSNSRTTYGLFDV